MKFKDVVFLVVFRVDSARLSIYGGKLRVLATLFGLFFKSKFHSRTDGIISHRIGRFHIQAFDYPTLTSLYIDIFLRRIYDFTAKNDRPFIVDCGAHIGMSVLFFKTIYPNSVIWAFEPNPEVFQILKHNMEGNNVADVRLFNCAVSDVEGHLPFYVPLKKGSINGSFVAGYVPSTVVLVETIRLSSVLSIPFIDFIKIDTEGEERKIVKDLNDSGILSRVSQLVVEYHHQVNGSVPKLGEFLSDVEKNNFAYHIGVVDTVDVSRQDLLIRFTRVTNE